MSGIPPTSALSSVWPGNAASTATYPSSSSAPIRFGSNSPIGLPTINNSNLPPSTIPTINNLPPPVPQPPRIPFPSIQPPAGLTNSLFSNNYATNQTIPPGVNFLPYNYAAAQGAPSFDQMAVNLAQNSVQNTQNEANQRRLTQLEDETAQRRNATSTLQQMGQQVLQGQMDIQDQVLQYQFILDQCIENLDHQSFILNGQTEEIALLHAKMRQYEYLMDAIKHRQENNHQLQNRLDDSNFIDKNFLYPRNSLSMGVPSISSFVNGGVTRVTSSKFQPFNPRYRPSQNRPSNLNESQNIPSSDPNSNIINTQFSYPVSGFNN